jgi:hypothetical protein
MRKLLRIQEAKSLLEPHLVDIVKVVEQGFNDQLLIKQYADSLIEEPGDWYKRTRATVAHNQIVRRAVKSFDGKSGIVAKDWGDIFAIKFQDDLFLRFKKFTNYGGAFTLSGIETAQMRSFLGQGQLPELPAEPTFIFAGYIPDRHWTKVMGVYVGCWLGKNLQWIIDIGRYELEQLDAFEQVQESVSQSKRVRFKPSDDENSDSKIVNL